MMRFDRFTERAQDAAARSYEILQRYGHNQVDTEHFLLALLEQPEGVIPQILEKLSVDQEMIKKRLDDVLRAPLTGWRDGTAAAEAAAFTPGRTRLQAAQALDVADWLPNDLLVKLDRCLMAHGVEGRYPFLDHRVIEFAANVPPIFKLKRLREKHILREGAEGLLPPAILNREKQPYRAPDQAALFPEGKGFDYVDEALSSERLEEAGFFSAKPLNTLLAKCRRQEKMGIKDGMALVGSLSVQLLYKQFVKGKIETGVRGVLQ